MNRAQDFKQTEERILEDQQENSQVVGASRGTVLLPLRQLSALASLSSFPSLEEATFCLEVREVMETPVSREVGQKQIASRSDSRKTKPPIERDQEFRVSH